MAVVFGSLGAPASRYTTSGCQVFSTPVSAALGGEQVGGEQVGSKLGRKVHHGNKPQMNGSERHNDGRTRRDTRMPPRVVGGQRHLVQLPVAPHPLALLAAILPPLHFASVPRAAVVRLSRPTSAHAGKERVRSRTARRDRTRSSCAPDFADASDAGQPPSNPR